MADAEDLKSRQGVRQQSAPKRSTAKALDSTAYFSLASAHEAAEVREYQQREPPAESQSFGSLADKLRGAWKPKG